MEETHRVRQKNHQPQQRLMMPPLLIMLFLWMLGVAHWMNTQDTLGFLLMGYIGLIIGVGIGGYLMLPDRYRPMARRLTMILLGSLLLAIAVISGHGNMQIEGLFFALLTGGGSYILLHYAIAKVFGPLIFGRIWCGWACWFGMVFELLPYPYSRYRIPGKWGFLRYVHFGLSLGIVALLWFGFGYDDGMLGMPGLRWFVVGVFMYLLIGIVMALILKDNRAFCKYLCPLAVPMKVTSRYSLLKVTGTPAHCATCEACVEMCQMNIRIKDYLLQGERVLSTECTLCQTCINVCPHNSLTLSFALDVGGKEIFDYEPPKDREMSPGI